MAEGRRGEVFSSGQTMTRISISLTVGSNELDRNEALPAQLSTGLAPQRSDSSTTPTIHTAVRASHLIPRCQPFAKSLADAAMSFSSVSVIAKALRVRGARI